MSKEITEKEADNVAVDVLVARTEIRTATCGIGRLPFPITSTEAKALESLHLVRIIGIFTQNR